LASAVSYPKPKSRMRFLTPLPVRVKGFLLLLPLAALCVTSGCAGVATAIYMNGEVKTDYYAPIDKVWKACEKTARDVRARDMVVDHEFRDGTIDAIIDNNRVLFSIEYKQQDLTCVGIRVGPIGDQDTSQFLHDLVAENLETTVESRP